MSKTHWKKLTDPKYLGAYAFSPGEERTVTIEMVQRETLTNSEGGQDECIVAYLKSEKPMVLNVTNCKAIESLHGAYIEDWAGKAITLYSTKVKAFGGYVDALRVKTASRGKTPKAEKPLPWVVPGNHLWSRIVNALREGKTFEELEKHVRISANNKELLVKEANEPL